MGFSPARSSAACDTWYFRRSMFRRFLPVSLVLILFPACERKPAQPVPAAPPKAAAKPAPAPETPKAPELPACPEKPNILLISLDTLRFDATSLGPKGRNQTPHLQQLAAAGMNFTRAYSTHDSTPRSHFSMLTGLVNGYQGEADVPEISMAHQLKRRGYRTFAVSANGNLSPKFTRSLKPFGSFVNLVDVWEGLAADRKAGLVVKLDERLKEYGYETNDWNRMMLFSSAPMVMRYLEPRLGGSQPFFAFVNLLEAHDPYLPSPRTYRREREERGAAVADLRFRPVPAELADLESVKDEKRKALLTATMKKAVDRAWSTTFDLDRKTIDIYRRRYHARVRELDAEVGAMVRALAERKLLDSTILVVTSDHGEAFGEDHLITHSFNNTGDREATNRVPLVIVFPPCYRFPPRAIDTLATIADIPPTVYDLLGIDTHPIWRKTQPGNVGRSLLPLIDAARRSATSSADTAVSTPMSETERKRQDEEALKRFKALGYLQ